MSSAKTALQMEAAYSLGLRNSVVFENPSWCQIAWGPPKEHPTKLLLPYPNKGKAVKFNSSAGVRLGNTFPSILQSRTPFHRNPHTVISQIGEPQYRPQNAIILIIGTPKKVPLIWGNPPYLNRAVIEADARALPSYF